MHTARRVLCPLFLKLVQQYLGLRVRLLDEICWGFGFWHEVLSVCRAGSGQTRGNRENRAPSRAFDPFMRRTVPSLVILHAWQGWAGRGPFRPRSDMLGRHVCRCDVQKPREKLGPEKAKRVLLYGTASISFDFK